MKQIKQLLTSLENVCTRNHYFPSMTDFVIRFAVHDDFSGHLACHFQGCVVAEAYFDEHDNEISIHPFEINTHQFESLNEEWQSEVEYSIEKMNKVLKKVKIETV